MQQAILEGYTNEEKGAYLSAIASIATADREASEEELQYLAELAKNAQLPDEQLMAVERAATETSGEELQQSLSILQNSELKYSLVADLIAFAKSDSNYSEAEQQNVQQIGEHLGVNQQQFSLLNQFAQNASTENTQQQNDKQGIFGLDGLQDKMKNAGINTGGLLKGLISIAAPILVGKILNRRGGGLGNVPGGNSGGLGGLLGSGGLGSLIGVLNGGRGFGNAGDLLGKVLGGRF
jgi:uncharacterized tellurite resistance protein B-like protein